VRIRWLKLFARSNGDVSVARLQIAWALLVLYMYFSLILLSGASAHAGPPSFALFADGLVVLIAGGAALIMEAWIESVPVSLPAPSEIESVTTSEAPYWVDIAVLQLVLGAVLVPMLLTSRALEIIGWRLVTITIVSEFVYFAFLSTQLVQKEELVALLTAIREERNRVAAVDVPADERQQVEREKRLDLLQRRAAILTKQIGRTFRTAEDTP
jgi:hypothetical protein